MTAEMTTDTITEGTPKTGTPVLEATGVTMRFGGLTAVRNVDFTVNAGEIVGLIGPNGAGKTTFFNCLTGLYVPTEGTVSYKGSVLPPKPHLVTKAGVARTFQNIRLFANMTVLENVLVGRHTRTKEGLWSALLRGPGFKKPKPHPTPAPWNSSSSSASRTKQTTSRATSPTETSASWKSPAPSPATPDSSSSTSPPPA